MPKRSIVYHAIDSERDYQKQRWGDRGENHEIDAFAAYIQEYTTQLIRVVGTTDDTERKLSAMRKIAALCVACMEKHGAPHRPVGGGVG